NIRDFNDVDVCNPCYYADKDYRPKVCGYCDITKIENDREICMECNKNILRAMAQKGKELTSI
ncbi:MAG: hypothetical protein ACOYB2_19915, partial [Limnohabitans sp.]